MPRPIPDRVKTLQEIQEAMDRFVASRGWYGADSAKPQEPRNLAASISLEANEVLECFQWSAKSKVESVAAELADVVLYVAQLANVLEIDLGEAIESKLQLNDRRFPAIEDDAWRERLAS